MNSHNDESRNPVGAHGRRSQPEAEALSEAGKKIEARGGDDKVNEDDKSYPKGLQLVLVTIALCLAVFCMALDNTIISTAIPTITDEFKKIDDVGWYGSAYLLTNCAVQLIYGKLFTFLSIKWTYLAALITFEAGSALCGAAPSSTAFIVGRAVAGLGAGGIFSGAVLILTHSVPLSKRPTYMGIVGAMYGIASVAGPLMGGAFTDKASWRWCFYINLPIGAVTVFFITSFYRPTSNKRVQSLNSDWKGKLQQFDIFGTVVFLPAVTCLLLALQWGGSKYPWSDPRIIALLVIFGVLVIVFASIQLGKKEHATIPPRILKQRSMAGAAFFSFTLGAAFFVFVYYLPIWFQAIKGVSAVQSGIMNIPLILSLIVVSLIGGITVQQVGYYAPFLLVSAILMTFGALMLSTLLVDTSNGQWIGYQILFGAGVGFGMQNAFIPAQVVLSDADIPVGTAVIMFSQTLGGTIFVSAAQNVFTNRLLTEVKQILPDLSPGHLLATGATSLKNLVPPEYLADVQVAYNTAITTTFRIAIVSAALSVFGAMSVEWKSVKGKKI